MIVMCWGTVHITVSFDELRFGTEHCQLTLPLGLVCVHYVCVHSSMLSLCIVGMLAYVLV